MSNRGTCELIPSPGTDNERETDGDSRHTERNEVSFPAETQETLRCAQGDGCGRQSAFHRPSHAI